MNAAMTQDGRQQADGAVAVLLDGKIHSLPQERLSRLKHDGGIALALPFVLEHFGLGLDEIGQFAVSTAGEPVPGLAAPVYLRTDGRLTLQDLGVEPKRIEWQSSHHASHAFEAIFAARNAGTLVLPALVFIADRIGQPGEHQSYYGFDGKQLRLLRRDPVVGGRLHGLGETYDRVTRHLGWRENFDAGKTMALAGLASPPAKAAERLFFDALEGAIMPLLSRDEHDSTAVLTRFCPARPSAEQCLQGGAALAAQLQNELEQAVIAALSPLLDAFHARILLCGGGLATNCRLLGRLACAFSGLAVQGSLAPGDSGQGIGNLVSAYFQAQGRLPGEADPLGGFWLKRGIWADSVPSPFRVPGTYRHILPIVDGSADIPKAASRLAQGDILAVMANAHEPGPRALGFHSLLADARDADMPRVLNRLVKGREDFRPFGAVMDRQAFTRWFGAQASAAPFMDLALPAPSAFKAFYPAAVHVDGSSRIQVLGRMHAGRFIAQLLDTLAQQHGLDVIINTSLNPKSQPIVYDAASLGKLLPIHDLSVY